jgi:hypothetical protein
VKPAKIGMPQQEPKPAPVLSEAELVASILTDPTLRRGDLVEFPDGPRIYKGSGRFSSHSLSDFEDIDGSSHVSRSAGARWMASGADSLKAIDGPNSRQAPLHLSREGVDAVTRELSAPGD